MTPHDFLLSHVARMLEEDDWFAAHRVRIIRQDSADLGEELAKSGAEVDGVSLVVAYDRETSIASSPRQFEVEFSLLAAEFPASNRSGGGWTTALGAADRARRDIEAADRSLIYRDTTHSTPGYGMLVATARYTTCLTVTADEAEDKGEEDDD